jgi:RNA recognition motif-containing protein
MHRVNLSEGAPPRVTGGIGGDSGYHGSRYIALGDSYPGRQGGGAALPSNEAGRAVEAQPLPSLPILDVTEMEERGDRAWSGMEERSGWATAPPSHDRSFFLEPREATYSGSSRRSDAVGDRDSTSSKKSARPPLPHAPPRTADGAEPSKGRTWHDEPPRGGKHQKKVVLFRNLPADMTADEVVRLAGREDVKVLFIPEKGHAFVEMPSATTATTVVREIESRQPVIRGKRVFAVISTRTSVRFRPGFGQTAGSRTEPDESGRRDDSSERDSREASGDAGPKLEDNPPSRVALLVISDVKRPVTVPVIMSAILGNARAAHPLRIILFPRQSAMHALIEMASIADAMFLVKALDQSELYLGSNTIRAQFSRMASVGVRYNNLKSMDFTNPALPLGPKGVQPEFSGLLSPQPARATSTQAPTKTPASSSGPGTSTAPEWKAPSGIPSAHGDPLPGHLSPTTSALSGPYEPASIDMEHSIRHGRSTTQDYFPLGSGLGEEVDWSPAAAHRRWASAPPDNLTTLAPGTPTNASSTPTLAHASLDLHPGGGEVAGMEMPPHSAPTSVVLASGFDPRMTMHDLFNLCGIYGDVLKVKRLHQRTDYALVEMASSQQAVLVSEMLNGRRLFGRILSIRPSPHTHVSPPNSGLAGTDGAGSSGESFADFARSRAHRFRNHERAHRFTAKPGPFLHLSNMPDGTSDRNVVEAIAPIGRAPVSLRFLDPDHHMCIIEMQSTEDALAVIVKLHNSTFLGRYLRVSFAKQSTTETADPAPAVAPQVTPAMTIGVTSQPYAPSPSLVPLSRSDQFHYPQLPTYPPGVLPDWHEHPSSVAPIGLPYVPHPAGPLDVAPLEQRFGRMPGDPSPAGAVVAAAVSFAFATEVHTEQEEEEEERDDSPTAPGARVLPRSATAPGGAMEEDASGEAFSRHLATTSSSFTLGSVRR